MDIGFLSSALPTPDDDVAWYNVIGKFKKYAADFASKYKALQNAEINSAKYPELSKEQLDLLRRGTYVRGTIQNVTSSIDGAWTWLQSKFGFNGINDAAEEMGLGLLPLVPIAVVAGAVTLISKWVLDYNEFSLKLAEIKRLEAKGYSSKQAAEIVSKTHGSSLFDLGNIGTVAVVGVVGVLLFINRDKLRF